MAICKAGETGKRELFIPRSWKLQNKRERWTMQPQTKARGLEALTELLVQVCVWRLKNLKSDVHRWQQQQKPHWLKKVWVYMCMHELPPSSAFCSTQALSLFNGTVHIEGRSSPRGLLLHTLISSGTPYSTSRNMLSQFSRYPSIQSSWQPRLSIIQGQKDFENWQDLTANGVTAVWQSLHYSPTPTCPSCMVMESLVVKWPASWTGSWGFPGGGHGHGMNVNGDDNCNFWSRSWRASVPSPPAPALCLGIGWGWALW
jgi:hypothetical protein